MWILAAILGVIVFFTVLISIPADLSLLVERDTGFRYKARVVWMFGLVGMDIPRRKKEKPKKKKKKKKKKRRNVKPFLALLRTKGFVRHTVKFVWDIIRLVRIRELKLDVRVGMSDPADTGMLLATIGPPVVFTNIISPVAIRIHPDFQRETLGGRFSGKIRIVPILLLLRSIRFVLSPTTIVAVKSMIMAYRK